jgi:hypothetical protein
MMTLLWDGAPIDRTTGDVTVRLDGRRMSALIMVQPEVATEFLTNRILKTQGIHARFLIATPPPWAPPKAQFANDQAEARVQLNGDRLLPFSRRVEALLDHPLRPAASDQRSLEPSIIGWDRSAKLHMERWFNEVGLKWRGERNDPFFARALEHAQRLAASITIFDQFQESPFTAPPPDADINAHIEAIKQTASRRMPVIGIDSAQAATDIVEWFAHQRDGLNLPVVHERDTREADYIDRVIVYMQKIGRAVTPRDLSRGPLQRLDRAVRERVIDSMVRDEMLKAQEITVNASQKRIEYTLAA